MLKSKHLTLALFFFLFAKNAKAQLGFSHELGVIAGYVEMRSDFGQREDQPTNFKNSGIGVGLIHYLNFAYKADCNCYSTDSYFSDHFKLRNEISWNRTALDHYGEWVKPYRTSPDADKLRAHSGVAQNFDIGTEIEFFPLSIRDFEGYAYRFSPFVGLGLHYTHFSPQVETTYGDGDVNNPNNFYSGWAPGEVDASSGSTWSIVTDFGVRYKLTRVSDLMLDMRFQFYMNDKIDGLSHSLNSNQHDDILLWLNIGYIHYLN